MSAISAGCLLSVLEMVGLPPECRDDVRSVRIDLDRVVFMVADRNESGRRYATAGGELATREITVSITRRSRP